MAFSEKDYQDILNFVGNIQQTSDTNLQEQKSGENIFSIEGQQNQNKTNLGIWGTTKEILKAIPAGLSSIPQEFAGVLQVYKDVSSNPIASGVATALGPTIGLVAGLKGVSKPTEHKEKDSLQKVIDYLNQSSEYAQQYWEPKLQHGTVPYYVAQGIEQSVHMLPYFLMGEEGSLAGFSVGAGGQEYIKRKKQGADLGKAGVSAVTTSGLEYLTELLPFHILFSEAKPLIKIVGVMASDIPGEEIANLSEAKMGEVLFGDKKPDYKQMAKDTAIVTALMSLFLGGGTGLLDSLVSRVSSKNTKEKIEDIKKNIEQFNNDSSKENIQNIKQAVESLLEDEKIPEKDKVFVFSDTVNSLIKQFGIKDYIEKTILSPEGKTRQDIVGILKRDIQSRLGPDIKGQIESNIMGLGLSPRKEIEELKQDIVNRSLWGPSPELKQRITKEVISRQHKDTLNKLQQMLLNAIKRLPPQEQKTKLNLLQLPPGQEFNIVPPEQRRDLPVPSTAIPLEGKFGLAGIPIPKEDITKWAVPILKTPKFNPKQYDNLLLELSSKTMVDWGKYDLDKARKIIFGWVDSGFLPYEYAPKLMKDLQNLQSKQETEKPSKQQTYKTDKEKELEKKYYEKEFLKAKKESLGDIYNKVRKYILDSGITPSSIDTFLGKNTPESREFKKILKEKIGFRAVRKDGLSMDEAVKEMGDLFPELGLNEDLNNFVNFIEHAYKPQKYFNRQETESKPEGIKEKTKKHPDMKKMMAEALRWKGAAFKADQMLEGDKKARLIHSKMTTKDALDKYLIKKFGIDDALARSVSNKIEEQNLEPDMSAKVEDFKGEPWAEEALKKKTLKLEELRNRFKEYLWLPKEASGEVFFYRKLINTALADGLIDTKERKELFPIKDFSKRREIIKNLLKKIESRKQTLKPGDIVLKNKDGDFVLVETNINGVKRYIVQIRDKNGEVLPIGMGSERTIPEAIVKFKEFYPQAFKKEFYIHPKAKSILEEHEKRSEEEKKKLEEQERQKRIEIQEEQKLAQKYTELVESQKIRFKKKKFDVAFLDNEGNKIKEKRVGYVYGDFGIYKTESKYTDQKKYVVTHLPSGMSIVDFGLLKDAKMFVKILNLHGINKFSLDEFNRDKERFINLFSKAEKFIQNKKGAKELLKLLEEERRKKETQAIQGKDNKVGFIFQNTEKFEATKEVPYPLIATPMHREQPIFTREDPFAIRNPKINERIRKYVLGETQQNKEPIPKVFREELNNKSYRALADSTNNIVIVGSSPKNRVIAHEWGHILGQKIKITPEIKQELNKVGEILYGKKQSDSFVKKYLHNTSELLAEANVYRVAYPKEAKKIMPTLLKEFYKLDTDKFRKTGEDKAKKYDKTFFTHGTHWPTIEYLTQAKDLKDFHNRQKEIPEDLRYSLDGVIRTILSAKEKGINIPKVGKWMEELINSKKQQKETGEGKGVSGPDKNMERNSREGGTSKDKTHGDIVQSKPRGIGEGIEGTGKRTNEIGVSKQGDNELRGISTSVSGEQGDNENNREDRASMAARSIARDINQRGIDRVSEEGEKIDSQRNENIVEPTARQDRSVVENMERTNKKSSPKSGKNLKEIQKEADKKPFKLADPNNIKDTLPVLYQEQQEDVVKAEQRLFAEEVKIKKLFDDTNRGILFTNTTGTGKTFTGLGIIKRFLRQGKENIIIVVPTDKKARDWVEDGDKLNIKIKQLKGIKDAEEGVVVTTYANFGQNDELFKRDWDLLVFDEAHKLSENMQGKDTKPWRKFWALTANDLNGISFLLSKKHEKELEKLPEAWGKTPTEKAYRIAISYANSRNTEENINEDIKKFYEFIDKARTARAVFLSATPFAYHKSLRYADGFLFDTGENFHEGVSGYGQPSPWETFLINHFGYRMRYGKLTTPSSEVDVGLMERRFNKWLREKGALVGRNLDIDKDYSRHFIDVPVEFGKQVQDCFDSINERDKNTDKSLYPNFSGWFNKLFNYHAKILLLEGLKAKAAVDRVKQHLELGRKVVVFHSRIKGEINNPFLLPFLKQRLEEEEESISPEKYDAINEEMLLWYRKNKEKIPPFNKIENVIEVFRKAFPNEAIEFFNGQITKNRRQEAVVRFNDDNSPVKIIVVQSDAGKEGISLHDTTGKFQRALISLALPLRPVEAIQTEGRIYRLGVKSNAIIEYLKTDLPLERFAFGTKINERAGTAENLALGDIARDLRKAFAIGYQESETTPPGKEQGTGGKEADKQLEAENPFQEAVAIYFAHQKRTAKTKSLEGVDFFTTPEPLGYKMVEWADIKPGQKVLEPSAGYGSIARFVPSNIVDLTMIEPSMDLSSRLAINAKGKILNSTFENLNKVNKYDTILMNPPYGKQSKTAFEHIKKATVHLKEGGRIVAIVPDSTSFWKKFDPWFSHPEQRGLIIRAEIDLPQGVFKRAGTDIKTKVLIIDKAPAEVKVSTKQQIVIPKFENIKDFFNHLDGLQIAIPRLTESILKSKEDKLREYGLNIIRETTDDEDTFYIKGRKTYDNKDFIKKELKARWSGWRKAWYLDAKKTSKEQIINALFSHVFGEDNKDIQYFFKDTVHNKGVSFEQANRVVEEFKKIYKNIPQIYVLREETELPEVVYSDIKQKKAEGLVYGVFYDGKAFIITKNSDSIRDVARALLHEVVGHYGLRTFYGDGLNSLLDRAWTNRRVRKEAQLVAKRYELNIEDIKERRIATEEALVNFIERGTKLSITEKIKNFIRRMWSRFAKSIGIKSRFDEEELQLIVKRIHEYVKGEVLSSKTSGGTNYILYSLKEDPDSFLFEHGKEQDKAKKEFTEQAKILLNLKDRQLLASFAKPHFLAKRWEHFKEAYQRERVRVKDRQREMHTIFEMVPTFAELSKKEEKQLAELVWALEGKKVKGLPRRFIKNDLEEGPYYSGLNEAHYSAYREMLEDKLPNVSTKVIQSFIEIRKALDYAQMQIINMLQKMKKKNIIDDSVIDEYMKSFGNIHNYFPHHRYGRYFVQAINPETQEVLYREHFNIPLEMMIPGKKAKEKFINAYLDKTIEKLNNEIKKGDVKNIQWIAGENTNLPEEIYEYPIPVEAMEQILRAASNKVKNTDPEIAKAIEKVLPESIADVIKSRGFGSHLIRRANIPGFERENLKKVFFDYVTGYTGWKSKIEAARDYTDILRKIKASSSPNEYAYTSRFIRDMLRNSDHIDELVAKFKTLAFIKYLGGVVSTGVLNGTQNIQVGIPRLTMETNKGTVFKYLKAAADTIISATQKAINGKEISNLTDEERRIIKELYAEGVTTANYIREISGKLLNRNLLVGKVINILGTTMSVPESFNRISIALAAFRMAREGAITNINTLKEYGVDLKTKKFSYEQAKQFASDIVDDVHFVFEKANMPEIFRSSKGGRLASSIYTFKNFTHSVLALWKWMLEQGAEGQKAFLKSMFAIMLLAGYKGLPFYRTITSLYKRIFGETEEPIEKIVNKLRHIKGLELLRNIIFYGVPSVFGVSLQPSIAIESPGYDIFNPPDTLEERINRALVDILGIPYSMLVIDPSKALKAIQLGQYERAMEYVLPRFISSVLRAYRESHEGVTTLSGKPIENLLSLQEGNPEVLKPKGWDIILRSLGFTSLDRQKNYDIKMNMAIAKQIRQEKMRYFANEILKAKKEGKPYRKILQEWRTWNRQMIKSGKRYMVISSKALRQSIRNRTRPIGSSKFEREFVLSQ